MKSIVSAILLPLLVSVAAAQQPADPSPDAIKAIVKSYLDIQAALAADRFADVKGPARLLMSQAVAYGKAGEAIGKAAKAVEAASDIKGARDAFGPLSDAVIARVQADGPADLLSDVRLAYCPMANRSWLQRDKQIRNPHYGAVMLTCGEFRPLAGKERK